MAICGEVNLPAGTVCEEVGGVIRADGKNLCLVRSENAHQYFARNDDGNGMERGQLTQRIQKTLQKQDAEHQARWDKIWDDAQCQAYRREEHKDYWLWNHAFYEADMMTLRHIAALVGA
jgi:hypothetical protein